MADEFRKAFDTMLRRIGLTDARVPYNHDIHTSLIFKDIATRDRYSSNWFYGFILIAYHTTMPSAMSID